MDFDEGEDEVDGLGIPVFHPSIAELQDFESFIEKIYFAGSYGYAKVVPPQGWFEHPTRYDFPSLDLTIPAPIKQLVSGPNGIHTVNLLEMKPLTVQQYYNLTATMEVMSNDNDDISRIFWRSLGNKGGMPDPIYGADIPGSLFGESFKSAWNLNKLKNKLGLIKNEVGGVNTPMLYVGSWRAMFAYHMEDMNLFSINYLHTGAPKSWCIIPPAQQKRFESFMNSYFKQDFNECSNYLRHKTKIVSPKKLRSAAIDVHQVVQKAGEFMITFPRAYHCGFNHGFNIAESTNFATTSWIPDGYLATACRCVPSSVRIYMPYLETLIRRDNVKTRTQRDAQDRVDRDILDETDLPLVLRCRCNGIEGPGISNKRKISDAVAHSEIFRCSGCERWCHTVCTAGRVIALDDQMLHLTSQPFLRQIGTCNMCLAIDFREADSDYDFADTLRGRASVIVEQFTLISGKTGSSKVDDCRKSSKKRMKVTKHHTEVFLIDGSKVVVGVGTRLKLRRSPSFFDYPLLLSRGIEDQEVEAKITDSQDGFFRIHVKVGFTSLQIYPS